MDMKTIGIPPCTGTPGQPLKNYDLGLENAWAERKAREPSVTKAKTRNRKIMHGSKGREL